MRTYSKKKTYGRKKGDDSLWSQALSAKPKPSWQASLSSFSEQVVPPTTKPSPPSSILSERDVNQQSNPGDDTKKRTPSIQFTLLDHKEQKRVEESLERFGSAAAQSSGDGSDFAIVPQNFLLTPRLLVHILRGAKICCIQSLQNAKTPEESEWVEGSKRIPLVERVKEWKSQQTFSTQLLAGKRICLLLREGRKDFEDLIRAANGEVLVEDCADASDLCIVEDGEDASKRRTVSRTWFMEWLSHGDQAFEKALAIKEEEDRAERERQRKLEAKRVCRELTSNDELLVCLLRFLQAKDLANASLVSLRWQMLVRGVKNDRYVHQVESICEYVKTRVSQENGLEIEKLHELGANEISAEHLQVLFHDTCFLSTGCYKKVYKVHREEMRRDEAVSVMDYLDVCRSGNLDVVVQEVKISLALSQLVSSGRCPNFVQTYQVFQSTIPPPENNLEENLWEADGGLYQYICMELCDLGDLEEYLKKCPDQMLSVDDTRSTLFQMCFALYKGWEAMKLRHFDVKLLNYFVQSRQPYQREDQVEAAGMRFRLPESLGFVVKLADFGTADTRVDTIGCKVTLDHYTTFENLPPEFFILGNDATTGGVDAFAFGLCMLHLFTGVKPYEETMSEVVCPAVLKSALKKVWNEIETYATVRRVASQDNTDSLYDTVYRHVVLFGLERMVEAFEMEGCDERGVNPVVRELVDVLGQSCKGRARAKARAQYEADRERFGLWIGEDQLFARAWRRFEQAGEDCKMLFNSIFSPHPQTRMVDMAQALANPFFEPLQL